MFVLRVTGHQDFQHGDILRALEVEGDCMHKSGRLEVHPPSDGILSEIYHTITLQICILCTAVPQIFTVNILKVKCHVNDIIKQRCSVQLKVKSIFVLVATMAVCMITSFII